MAPKHKRREAHVRRALAAGRGRITPTGREVKDPPLLAGTFTPTEAKIMQRPGHPDVLIVGGEVGAGPVERALIERGYAALELRVMAHFGVQNQNADALAATFSVGGGGIPPGQSITFREDDDK